MNLASLPMDIIRNIIKADGESLDSMRLVGIFMLLPPLWFLLQNIHTAFLITVFIFRSHLVAYFIISSFVKS